MFISQCLSMLDKWTSYGTSKDHGWRGGGGALMTNIFCILEAYIINTFVKTPKTEICLVHY